MAGGFDNIKSWGREWRRQAENADFLGEVALTDDDLERKLDVLSEYRKRLYESPDTAFALAIAAINWDPDETYADNGLDLAVLTENPFNLYILYGHVTEYG